MKHLIAFRFSLLAFLLAVTTFSFAQNDKPSPPATASGKIGGVDVTVNYNSPAVKGRQVWGGLVPYDKVWRTGANEATVINFSKDVMVEGQKLAAGKYSVYTIPGQNEWTVIFNKQTGQWGTQYDQGQDALRVKVKPVAAKTSSERMTFDVKEKGKNNGVVTLSWEKLQVPISVRPAAAS
jgi:hypothetical protein